MDIQSLFNTTRSKSIIMYHFSLIDHESECPHCQKRAFIILCSTLLIGDLTQLDYPLTIDNNNKAKSKKIVALPTSPTT